MSKRKRRYKSRKRNRCRFCKDGIEHIDYKDIHRLRKLTTSRGQLMSRKRSGNCSSCQRKVRVAVKRARYLGLLPYVGE